MNRDPAVQRPSQSPSQPLCSLSDDALLARLGALVQRSRQTEAELVAHLGEVDRRRLYLGEACASMFVYCTERLHFSEPEAYLRITAARIARAHPLALSMLADGRLHLTAIALVAPHLTAENAQLLLEKAAHRSKRQVAELVAELAPRPDVAPSIRKLPTTARPASPAACASVRPPGSTSGTVPSPGTGDVSAAATASGPRVPVRHELGPDGVVAALTPGGGRPPAIGRATLEPLAPGRYRVQFTASAELREKLERLRDLMRPAVPDGDLAAIIDQAVTEKLQRLEARRFAARERGGNAAQAPTTLQERAKAASSRHVPAAVRRVVAARDGRRCAFVDGEGHRCTARGDLEFHHRRPYGCGGGHSVDNLGLLCRAHNRYLAEVDYGSRRAGGAPWQPVRSVTRAAPGSERPHDSVRTELPGLSGSQ